MNLKTLLKKIKLNESTISMILGAVIIVVVGVLVLNYFRGLESESPTPTIETQDTATTKLPTTHIVAEGEDLWSISEKYYKTGYNWVDIAEENELTSPSNIVQGQQLTIPDAEPRLASSEITQSAPTKTVEPTATEAAGDSSVITQVAGQNDDQQASIGQRDQEVSGGTYTVVKGDTLWDIALKAYGDGYKWTEIAEANNLANPNLIHRGNVFVLPR